MEVVGSDSFLVDILIVIYKEHMSALCMPHFYNLVKREKNHNCPFPSSFGAGVEKEVVLSLLILSHITKEHGAL